MKLMPANKTVFIVAGFKHSPSEPQYTWMKQYFAARGFLVKAPDVHWNNRTLTDWVQSFSEYYQANKTAENHVIGFSYGAMIAMVSAVDLQPDRLYLCSLSPYFSEDLDVLKPSWVKMIGKRRMNDFGRHSAAKISAKITSKTTVFYGSAEGVTYPQLKVRCQEVARSISKANIAVALGAPHQIDFASYIDVIKEKIV